MWPLLTKGSGSALCLYSGCYSVYMPDVIFLLKRQWKCIVSIFRMSFCLYAGCQVCFNKRRGSALCLYSGCHFVYMPVSLLFETSLWKCIVLIFRMSCYLYAGCHFCFKTIKVHCVYIPDAILSICRMSLLLKQKPWKIIVSICRMSFCLYAGCHFCIQKTMKMHCVYIPDAISSNTF